MTWAHRPHGVRTRGKKGQQVEVLIQCVAYFENSGPTSQYNILSCFTRLTSGQSKLCPHWLLGSSGAGVFWGCFWGLGFVLVFGSLSFGLLPLPICRVSILPMMTWAHRPHGVRARAKK